jgi:uncharacterized protein YdhG (YjbR/CyaY superfamily)
MARMSKSNQPLIDDYLEALPPERERAVSTLRELILETIPEAEESLRYKMPTYEAAGDFLAAVASQKHYLSLYMNSDLVAAHKDELVHLDCGKSCIRFKRLDDLPLDTVRVILQETYEMNHSLE